MNEVSECVSTTWRFMVPAYIARHIISFSAQLEPDVFLELKAHLEPPLEDKLKTS